MFIINIKNLFGNAINIIANELTLNYHKVNIGKNLKINGIIKICGSNSIRIGNNFTVNSGKNYNIIGGDIRCILSATGKGKINIGNNVGISNSAIVSKSSIMIEDDVMIGGSCKIYDTDFHSLNYEKRMMRPDLDIVSKPILIKKGAFIGANSIVLKGVTVGEKSIIGAGSVVTKSIPDGEIWAGNPAKFIRKIEEQLK